MYARVTSIMFGLLVAGTGPAMAQNQTVPAASQESGDQINDRENSSQIADPMGRCGDDENQHQARNGSSSRLQTTPTANHTQRIGSSR